MYDGLGTSLSLFVAAVDSRVTEVGINTTAIQTLSNDVEILKNEVKDLQDMEISGMFFHYIFKC